MSADDLGPLALALARAQVAFPPVRRDKHVHVTTKAGSGYDFDYAPLESIIEATRGPLSANGLAVVQVLDEDSLVTRLIHESGASLTGRIDLPRTDGMQEMGSAITYLRRYALQSILGVAAEDDDDGNRAIGGSIQPRQGARSAPRRPEARQTAPEPAAGVWQGSYATTATRDGNLREDRKRGPVVAFELRDASPSVAGRGKSAVVCAGALATAVDIALRTHGAPSSMTVWGEASEESFEKDGRAIAFSVIAATRVQTPEWTVPAIGASEPVESLDDLPF